jgi:hypothetical protein
MKKGGVLLFLLICIPLLGNSWGFYAHKEINRLATFTLPPPLIGFYKANIRYITEHAVDADRRRYLMKGEACRHYLDGDHYEQALPFDTLPHYWKAAVALYSEDSLKANGIVPWHVFFAYKKLIWAFADTSKSKEEKTKSILKLSSDLGHYVGDLHVPLHTTSNYNGQKTNQHGIHALWESRLPPLFDSSYNFFVGKAQFFMNPIDSIWKALERSHFLVDSVLALERKATELVKEEHKYTFVSTDYNTKRDYSIPFCNVYNNLMGDMVQERMTKSVLFLGSLWFSAWVEAGQPNLNGFPILEEKGDKIDVPAGKEMIGRKE